MNVLKTIYFIVFPASRKTYAKPQKVLRVTKKYSENYVDYCCFGKPGRQPQKPYKT